MPSNRQSQSTRNTWHEDHLFVESTKQARCLQAPTGLRTNKLQPEWHEVSSRSSEFTNPTSLIGHFEQPGRYGLDPESTRTEVSIEERKRGCVLGSQLQFRRLRDVEIELAIFVRRRRHNHRCTAETCSFPGRRRRHMNAHVVVNSTVRRSRNE